MKTKSIKCSIPKMGIEVEIPQDVVPQDQEKLIEYCDGMENVIRYARRAIIIDLQRYVRQSAEESNERDPETLIAIAKKYRPSARQERKSVEQRARVVAARAIACTLVEVVGRKALEHPKFVAAAETLDMNVEELYEKVSALVD